MENIRFMNAPVDIYCRPSIQYMTCCESSVQQGRAHTEYEKHEPRTVQYKYRTEEGKRFPPFIVKLRTSFNCSTGEIDG